MSIFFGENLIYRDLEFDSSKGVLEFLADSLYKEGFIKEGFKEAIIKREEEYPTAIPAEGPKIAIPHADHKLVKKAAIAIGILKNSIDFHSMEEPENIIPVKIVIMLALDEPHGHIEMLQKIVTLIKNQKAKQAILKASSKEKIYEILEPILLQ